MAGLRDLLTPVAIYVRCPRCRTTGHVAVDPNRAAYQYFWITGNNEHTGGALWVLLSP